jgi:hypothetical protein
MPLLKNPLNDYATHNYVWTLSAMYPGEVNDPKNYKNGTGKLPIIASGGLGNRKTITTTAEDKINANVEYYIDNVEITTTAKPTEDTPTSSASRVAFTVYEPYSIGLFIQTIALASSRAGFLNYQTAPFLLTLQFKGFKDDGSYEEVAKKHFVINLTTITFKVDAGGSNYQVEATPWNQLAYGDTAQTINEEVNITGATVSEVISTGTESLATVLNNREIRKTIHDRRLVSDQYQITFPFDIGGDQTGAAFNSVGLGGVFNTIQNGINRVNNTISAIGSIGTAFGNLGTTLDRIGQVRAGAISISDNGIIGRGLNALEGPESANVRVNNTLTQLGTGISQVANALSISGITGIGNEIGQSRMIDNFNEFGSVIFERDGATWDQERRVYQRGNMTVSESNRIYNFPANTTVEQIIAEVVLASKWGQTLVEKSVDQYGMKEWFRIHAKVEILSLAEMQNTGRPALKYIYQVYPYYIHQSTFNSSWSENNTEGLIGNAVKAYNYIYTGLNRDILDFEIEYKYAYQSPQPVDDNQQNTTRQTTVGGAAVAEQQPAYAVTTNTGRSDRDQQGFVSTVNTGLSEYTQFATNVRTVMTDFMDIYKLAGGSFIDNDKTRVAYYFRNNVLNPASDLQSLSLTIWGDPYYLNDSDFGNYVAPFNAYNINADFSIDYQRSVAYVLVKFNSSIDYYNDLLAPDPADLFTGVYEVGVIEHSFSNGQFKQTLTLTRVANQSRSSISKLKQTVNAFFNTLGAIGNLASVLGATNVAQGIGTFMQEASPVANQLLGLAEIGSNLKQIVNGNYSDVGSALTNLDSFFQNTIALESGFRNTLSAIQNFNLNRPQNLPIAGIRPIQPSSTIRRVTAARGAGGTIGPF